MMTLSRCIAAVATTTCFLASPGVVFAGELAGQKGDPQPETLQLAGDADETPAATEAEDAETAEGPGEQAGPQFALEAPTLQYGDQGPGRGRGGRMTDAGIALTVLGGVSLVGSTFFLMVCPSEAEVITVGQGEFEDVYEIKCFDAKTTVTDRFREFNNPGGGKENEVTLKSGAGNPVLPGLITMAAAGGVMLGTGIALLVIGSKRKKQGMAAAPMFNGSTAGMMVSGKF